MKGDLCFLGPDPGLTCKLTLQRGPLGCACEWAPSCWGMKCLPVCVLSCFSCVQLFSTLWTVARQDPLSMGFSKQEYWSGLPCPPLGDLPDPGIEPLSLASHVLAGGFFTMELSGKPLIIFIRSDQIRSVAQLCPTLCDPMNHSTPGLPVHHQLPEFTETHVH